MLANSDDHTRAFSIMTIRICRSKSTEHNTEHGTVRSYRLQTPSLCTDGHHQQRIPRMQLCSDDSNEPVSWLPAPFASPLLQSFFPRVSGRTKYIKARVNVTNAVEAHNELQIILFINPIAIQQS
jgi:hypothetical protein